MLAAVEEHDRAIGEVCGRLVEDLLEREEAIFDRQRKLLLGEEHHRVLAELGEDLVQREHRAERIAVRPLVSGDQEALAIAQLLEDELSCRGGLRFDRRRAGAGPAHSLNILLRRSARSIESS